MAALIIGGLFTSSELEAAKANMTIAGGGKGSGGLAEVVNRVSKKMNMTVQPTGGFVANTCIIGTGHTQFARKSYEIFREQTPVQLILAHIISVHGSISYTCCRGDVADSCFGDTLFHEEAERSSVNTLFGLGSISHELHPYLSEHLITNKMFMVHTR
jgi:hypothetical protein